MATYLRHREGVPFDTDWELLIGKPDAAVVHESEDTFWRRLMEDGYLVLDQV